MKIYPKKAMTRDIATQINYKLGTILVNAEKILTKDGTRSEYDMQHNDPVSLRVFGEREKEVEAIRQLLLDNIEE